MAEKELCRLKRRELLQMLVMQCEEAERLQRETDQVKARLGELEESYERLKVKLNIKDERLDQKDAKIAELKQVIEELQTSGEQEYGTTAIIVPVHTRGKQAEPEEPLLQILRARPMKAETPERQLEETRLWTFLMKKYRRA